MKPSNLTLPCRLQASAYLMNDDMQIKMFIHTQNLKKSNNIHATSLIYIALKEIKFDSSSFDMLEWSGFIINPP